MDTTAMAGAAAPGFLVTRENPRRASTVDRAANEAKTQKKPA
jgi:hypothetical protein